ncbi:MAG TPA: hypothetical protein P5234_01890 [Thermoanaerobaculaceae bacterium]|nr:hypothetical protein [Thermoanaerobaculaceae bacterium]HRS14979.1 hypothetical protein [Thermoanaerobaculaceae bacterium]
MFRMLLVASLLGAVGAVTAAAVPSTAVSEETVQETVASLLANHGEAHAARIRQGVRQVAERWWAEDGDAAAFKAFCEASFLVEPAELERTALRLERALEQIHGRLHETRRELLEPLDLDTGPVARVDELLANLDLAAHVGEDLFRTRVAFLALLNFPVRTLADYLCDGPSWDRATWARARMMDAFADRIPAAVVQEVTRASTVNDAYIADYNIIMGNVMAPDGSRPFPGDLKLITHWGLRDELKSHYGRPDGLPRQRLIARVMERIVRQEIPAAVIDNAGVLWRPDTNEVRAVDEGAPAPPAGREPDTRYARILDYYKAQRAVDPYVPTAPTAIARSFERGRQMPEQEVEKLLVSVLAAPEVKQLGALVARRLGRPLEAFDIWYTGFAPRGRFSEAELDRIVAGRYPTAEAFQNDIPGILTRLGFAPERARWLADRIAVDASRGAGHAMGAVRREDKAHLRTRVGKGGMSYKGYNIAIHELGHNVEQVFSLNGIDHWFLNGVPNTAFTEAFAFSFQRRDLELLGLQKPEEVDLASEALHDLWQTYEISGVSLVDMRVWRWLYAHPDATPAELREATLRTAREVWNDYYAPVFGIRDQEILAIYSHTVTNPLYLPDYAIGHIIAFQVAAKLQGPNFGSEFERMARQGLLTPDAWMRGAVGAPISSEALLAASRKALATAR